MSEAVVHLECFNDEAVVRGLGLSRAQISHAGCKGRVSAGLRRAPSGSIGLVDEDPGQPVDGFLASFRTVDSVRHAELRRHESSGKWLIVIKPRLEEMLLECGSQVPALWKAHRLPATASELHKLRRSQTDRITAFVNLARADVRSPLHRIAAWLEARLRNSR